MAVLGIGIGRLRLINRYFRQNGFTGHRFGFRHLYPHLGHPRRFGIVFNLHRQMAGRERLYQPQLDIPHPIRPRYRRILACLLQSPATGQRLASRTRRQIQPGLGRPDGRRFLRRTPKHAGMDRPRLGNRRRIDAGVEAVIYWYLIRKRKQLSKRIQMIRYNGNISLTKTKQVPNFPASRRELI